MIRNCVVCDDLFCQDCHELDGVHWDKECASGFYCSQSCHDEHCDYEDEGEENQNG